MKTKFMEFYSTFDKTNAFEEYEQLVTDNFACVERNGLQVDYNKFVEHFKANGIDKNRAFTEYNIWTTTGRPSNKFGGVNYAALPKESGCRESFVSRWEKGMLLEMDFDAYHPRLIADIIGYDLPDGSVHEYFGKKELSEEEYDQSKKITFRLLYGGIDDDFAKIPFFKKTRSFIRTLWSNFKENGFVVTPRMKRPLYKNCLHDMNPNKLFNYLLQASETEYNLHVLNDVNDLLSEYNTNIILYTYDSLLFDYDMSDGKELLNKLKDVMNQAGRFPVKIKAGINYHAMTDMTSRIA